MEKIYEMPDAAKKCLIRFLEEIPVKDNNEGTQISGYNANFHIETNVK